MLVTIPRFQEFPLCVRGWLKAAADRNISSILVTAAVFQEPIFWLKAGASRNIRDISVTKTVFQEEILPLKELAR